MCRNPEEYVWSLFLLSRLWSRQFFPADINQICRVLTGSSWFKEGGGHVSLVYLTHWSFIWLRFVRVRIYGLKYQQPDCAVYWWIHGAVRGAEVADGFVMTPSSLSPVYNILSTIYYKYSILYYIVAYILYRVISPSWSKSQVATCSRGRARGS